jgi:nucleoid-associated protein YgaU
VKFLQRLFGRFGPSEPVPWAPDPTDAPIPQKPIERPGRDDRVYSVKAGDTLESIAKEVYGNSAHWTRLAQANRERLGDPPVLYPGLSLTLPR